ncbi:MAG: M1 family metallopeptidase [Acidimicrobiales bacterium]
MKTTDETPTDDDVRERYRLPGNVQPIRYDLELSPDLEAATFEGRVTIEAEVLESTDALTLHALDLEIDAAWVTTGGRNLDATVEFDPPTEQVTLTLPQPAEAGTAEITISFRGVLNDLLLGFYRSTFTQDGESRTIAVTQFESTHARRAFPCFDEPEYKAVYGITLVVRDDLFAVSNAAEVHRTPTDDGRVSIAFADTMKMSTYLVAWVIGPLEATEPRMIEGRNGPIPLRIVAPPGNLHMTEFALDAADHCVRYFEDYYDIAYPGDKIDLVAVPDFAFGAMENLGCITFREILLLIDPEQATKSELQRAVEVIDHELAHMWFGDLVTMKWWNGIWLNEAFATFMEVMAADAFRPDWDVWTTFGLERSVAFDTDALHATRPIEFEVVTAADSEGMFDVLTYEKGASVLRMLEQYLGAEVFRDGIRTYLAHHAYANTETTDLWDALEEVSGQPVRRIMDAWILRGGHPMVTVTSTESGVALAQSRFSYDPAEAGEGWPVPVVLRAAHGDVVDEHRLLLESPTTVELSGPATWVQPNLGGNGFYRSDLSRDLRTALASAPGATALERFVLVDDTWASFLGAQVERDDVVAVVRTMATTESDPSVWRRLSGMTSSLHALVPEADRASVAELACEIGAAPLARIDADVASGPTERSLDLRGVLFSLLGVVGDQAEVRARSREVFDGAPADAALQAAALATVAAWADAEDHAEIERRWRAAATPQEEMRYLYALASTPDEAMFRHTLELTRDDIRTQNAPYVIRLALGHLDLGALAWEFLVERWDELVARFPTNSHVRMLEGIRSVTDRARATGIEAFLGDHPLDHGTKQITQHLERMWVSVRAAERLAQGPNVSPKD